MSVVLTAIVFALLVTPAFTGRLSAFAANFTASLNVIPAFYNSDRIKIQQMKLAAIEYTGFVI